jgi:hypothetical protein
MTDPLRGPDGRFRAPTAAERLGFMLAPPPPEPKPPARRGPQIPAGPMGGEPDGTDLIRAALRHRR